MIKNSIQIDRNSNLLSVPSVEAPKANSEKKWICKSRQFRFISSAYFPNARGWLTLKKSKAFL